MDRGLRRGMNFGIQQDPTVRDFRRHAKRIQWIRQVVQNPKVEHDIECSAERLGAHLPEVQLAKLYVGYSHDRLDQFGLLDQLWPRVKRHHLRTQKCTLHRPESRVARDVQNPLPSNRTSEGL